MPDIEIIKAPPETEIPNETLSKDNVAPHHEEEMTDILKDIRDNLPAKEAPKGPSSEQIRTARIESLKEKFGWTDEQALTYESDLANHVGSAVAPLQEKLAWTELKTEMGGLTADVEENMKDELKQYPPQMRGDKVLLEKIYYMTIGKKTRFSQSTSGGSSESSGSRQSSQEGIVGRRVVTSQGSSIGLSGATDQKIARLSDEERTIARKMRITDDEYAKYRENAPIESFKAK